MTDEFRAIPSAGDLYHQYIKIGTHPVDGHPIYAPVNISPIHVMALDYDVNNNPIYIGLAPLGSAKSAAVWQIRKLSYNGSQSLTDLQFANGVTDFSAVWDNRAALTYS